MSQEKPKVSIKISVIDTQLQELQAEYARNDSSITLIEKQLAEHKELRLKLNGAILSLLYVKTKADTVNISKQK